MAESTVARKTDRRGRKDWVPGVSGNPAGKPKGTRDLWPELYQALRAVEKEKKQLLMRQ